MYEETFNLKHTVLYAKHWYARFDPKGKRTTIWHDLQELLEADGYCNLFIEKNAYSLRKSYR